jgi:peptidoglycan pentaglycine glycine transferase (the first glycine)
MSKLSTKEVLSKEQWEGLAEKSANKTFMQSWSSMKWRQDMGQKVWLWGVYDGDNLIAGSLVAMMPAFKKFNLNYSFLFVPHGPLIDKKYWNRREEIFSLIVRQLKKIGKENRNISFIRISPAWPRNDLSEKSLKKMGLRKAPMFVTPEVTWTLDLDPSEDALMKGMRKTTRYLIRQGLKNDKLTVGCGDSAEEFKSFLDLYKTTVTRHDFHAFSLDYLAKEMKHLKESGELLIFNADYLNNPIASAMIIFYQGTAYYHQGASANDQPKDAPGSYLLQWKIIQEAKSRGCHSYNFWGIADTDDPRHAYRGLTLFKKGFGGDRVDYVFTQDIPLSWFYWLNSLVEKIRRKKRRL